MGEEIADKINDIKLEAQFNASFVLDVMKAMNPVINELRIEIVKLKEELASLREELCL